MKWGRIRIKNIFPIAFFFVILHLPAFLVSQNLVSNCGFELYSNCPNNHGQISVCEEWYAPGEGTTDYCNKCNQTNYSVPSNLWGNQEAREGRGYAHLICLYPSQASYREYVQIRLACPMVAGEAYDVSFYVSCSDKSKYAIDRIGAYFSVDAIHQNGDLRIPIPGEPPVQNAPGYIMKDKDSWFMISGTYVATGGEEYLTIGNFMTNSETEVENLGGAGLMISSYYLDDVAVIPQQPMLRLGNDTTLCPNTTLTLDATLPCAAEYLWTDGSTEPSITVSKPGTYGVQVSLGCYPVYDEIKVDYFEQPDLGFPSDTVLCSGTSILLDPGPGYLSYAWQDGSTDQTYTADHEGLFWVEAKNDLGCLIRDSANVEQIEIPVVFLGNDTTLCYGSSLLLNPGNGDAYTGYEWQDFSTGKEFLVRTPDTYWVYAENPCGFDRDTVEITFINCDAALFLPNAFTPNGDNLNDIFMAKGVNIGKFSMYVYDRWGTLLFQTSDLDNGWDGRFNGNDCPVGVYAWIVYYENIEGTPRQVSETLKGTLTLLR